MDQGDRYYPLSVTVLSLTVSIFPPVAHPFEGIDVTAPGQRLTNLDYLALKIVFTIINCTINYYALYADEETNFIYQIPVF